MVKRKTSAAEAMLSIGALAQATGIPVETLRTWESRYGFPAPERRESGHRVYPLESIARLKKISEALAAGLRPREVVGLPALELDRVLETLKPAAVAAVSAPAPVAAAGAETSIAELLGLVTSFDAGRLTLVLTSDWARMEPLVFLTDRVAPLVHAVGEAWEKHELAVRHEHFLSERVGDLLRTLRLRLEERATGPRVVLATLPGETHTLGLQMAALTFAIAGWEVIYLGAEVPIEELAAPRSPARPRGILRGEAEVAVRAVGVSVSSATTGGSTTRAVQRLRGLLAPDVELLVGGAGAPKASPGVTRLADLRELHAWAQGIGSGAGASRRP